MMLESGFQFVEHHEGVHGSRFGMGDQGVGELVLDVARRNAKHPFVRVTDRLPATKDVAYTNFCDITARIVRGRVMTISCFIVQGMLRRWPGMCRSVP